jgi:hypothetical protein
MAAVTMSAMVVLPAKLESLSNAPALAAEIIATKAPVTAGSQLTRADVPAVADREAMSARVARTLGSPVIAHSTRNATQLNTRVRKDIHAQVYRAR